MTSLAPSICSLNFLTTMNHMLHQLLMQHKDDLQHWDTTNQQQHSRVFQKYESSSTINVAARVFTGRMT